MWAAANIPAAKAPVANAPDAAAPNAAAPAANTLVALILSPEFFSEESFEEFEEEFGPRCDPLLMKDLLRLKEIQFGEFLITKIKVKIFVIKQLCS